MAPLAKRNRFNFVYDNLFTCNMGRLICYDVIPVLPGDYMRVVHEQITKAQAMVAPAYGKLNVKLMDFFVPTRLLWKNWEDFWATALDGETSEYVHPYIEVGQGTAIPSGSVPEGFTNHMEYATGSSSDYMGLPLYTPCKHSAFWHRGVARIINEWMINQNVEDPVGFSDDDGKDTTTYRGLFHMNWRRDRFTNCLPWQEKGDPVGLPLNPDSSLDVVSAGAMKFNSTTGGDTRERTMTLYPAAGSIPNGNIRIDPSALEEPSQMKYRSGLGLQLTGNFSNMRDLAVAQQLDRLFRMNARTGSRYIEKLLANYGVHSSDSRLQRSEYLGGSKSICMISEILQTSSTDATSPQGNQAGHMYGVGRSNGWSKTFEEFGYVFCFYTISPKAVYSQGMPRELMKRDALEYALPMLSHLPEDAVYTGELKWNGEIGAGGVVDYGETDAKTILGYQPRYSEYRQHYSKCCGNFRPYLYTDNTDPDNPVAVGGNMADWTFSRSFATTPTLSKEFIQVEDIRRPFATSGTTDHLFMVNVTTNCRVRRCLPKVGLPAGTF